MTTPIDWAEHNTSGVGTKDFVYNLNVHKELYKNYPDSEPFILFAYGFPLNVIQMSLQLLGAQVIALDRGRCKEQKSVKKST